MKHLFALSLVAVLAIGSIAAAPATGRELAPTVPPRTERVSAPISDLPASSTEVPGSHSCAFIAAGFLSLIFLGVVTENQLRTFDANLLVTQALPAANANNTSPSINLSSLSAGRIPRVEVDISLPATPSLTDTDSITLTLMDSADNVTFAAVADVPVITTTGAGGVGGPAVDRRFKLPIGIRQYIAVQAAVGNGGGDNTAISSQLALVF